MNKKSVFSIIIVAMCIAILGFLVALKSEDFRKNTRGSKVVDLEPGQKLENVVWREDTAWYLTRLMKDGEEPEIHTFYKSSVDPSLDSDSIIIVEHSFE